jgi:HlyD family secretion protein
VTAAKGDALLIPREAVVSGVDAGQSTVVVLDDAATARRARVKLGIQDEEFVEILSGLDDGTLVATSGVADLRDGDAVVPRTNPAVAFAR